MTTQCEQILAHLKSGRGLTQVDAFNEYGCWRLAARIENLRAQGNDIVTQRVVDGEKCYARYLLRSDP